MIKCLKTYIGRHFKMKDLDKFNRFLEKNLKQMYGTEIELEQTSWEMNCFSTLVWQIPEQ